MRCRSWKTAAASLVRATTATWFYALTATRFQSSADGIREDQLRNAVPWWNYAFGGRVDPGGLMALHTKAQHMFVSDYSAPKVLTVDASGAEVRSDGLEIDPKTGVAYYGDARKGQIFRVDLGLEGSRRLFAATNFKNNEQIGLAVDSDGSLYSNNGASNAEFGGRIFRFTQPAGARDHVGSINYYSFLLQSANPASASAMTMGPGSAPAVSAEDLFLVDDLAQIVKRVPVRAAFDPTRRIGQPWATLPFPARAVDFEFHTPAEGSTDRADGVLLVDATPGRGAERRARRRIVRGAGRFADGRHPHRQSGQPGGQRSPADHHAHRRRRAPSGDGSASADRPGARRDPELRRGAERRRLRRRDGPRARTGRRRLQRDGQLASRRAHRQRAPAAGASPSPRRARPRPASPSRSSSKRATARRARGWWTSSPTVTMFDATVGSLDPKGEVVLVSGPQPATLALDPNADRHVPLSVPRARAWVAPGWRLGPPPRRGHAGVDVGRPREGQPQHHAADRGAAGAAVAQEGRRVRRRLGRAPQPVGRAGRRDTGARDGRTRPGRDRRAEPVRRRSHGAREWRYSS